MYKKYIKRPMDVCLSLFALLALSPLMLMIAVMVLINFGAPIIFKQERVGKDNKVFYLYKFRTMKNKTDENGQLLPDIQRLTKFGLFLRNYSLDELPSLINILNGDLSIVGPRPLLVCYLPYYNEHESIRHSVRGGLSGLAQVNGRNTVSWEERFAYDIQYVNNITFLGDVKIILKTFLKVFCKSEVGIRGITTAEDFNVYRMNQINQINL